MRHTLLTASDQLSHFTVDAGMVLNDLWLCTIGQFCILQVAILYNVFVALVPRCCDGPTDNN